MEKVKTNTDQRLINALLLHSSLIDDTGLLNGKTGISIFFYHLSRQTGNTIYADYGGNLLDQVFKATHITSPVDFLSGLAGIGWGVEYLLQNGFVEAAENDILEEVDTAVFQLDRKQPQLPRNYDDFYGYGLYYLCRAKDDIWDEEAFQLIWDDIKKLLNEPLPEKAHPCPAYIISLLWFILEIRNRSWCPSDIDEVLFLIPEFVSKYFSKDWNPIEWHYLESILKDLELPLPSYKEEKELQFSLEQRLKQYSQAALFEMLFESIQPAGDVASDYSAGILKILEHEEIWGKLFDKSGNKEQDHLWSMSGFALGILNHDITPDRPFAKQEDHRSIYIFNRKSRAAEYGIGTYIKELTAGLKNSEFHISVIHLDAERSEFAIEDQEGIQNWYIPGSSNSSSVIYNDYNRIVITFMQLHISNTENLVFHLNFMRDFPLAKCLRETFMCKILLVVHYMDWSFILNGNLPRMREISVQPEETITDPLERNVLSLFKEDRKLLEYVDQIICLANYAFDMLCHIYEIDPGKITVVNNGLSNSARLVTPDERSGLRKKYRIGPDEKIILYAGRLDEIKGVSYLIKAFREVLKHEPDCQLWIVGDGAYNPLFREAEGIWNRLCFTGQISREQLFELYLAADIGVIPSLFEPFGYVAVEMMMHGLPVIATATGGLDEIVQEGVSGYKVPVLTDNGTAIIDTCLMAQKIVYLLQNPQERARIGQNGRKRYLEQYTAAKMCKKMLDCYRKAEIALKESDRKKTDTVFEKTKD